MGELTETDRDDLIALFAGSTRSPEHLAFLATPAVEQIIARHVSAALTAAADEIDGACFAWPRTESGHCRNTALRDAARIVRNQATR